MKHNKNFLSLLLTVCMAVSLIPATVMADGDKQGSTEITQEPVKEQKITSEDVPGNSDELFEGYVNRKFGIEDSTASTTKNTKKRGAPVSLRSQLSAVDQEFYDILFDDINTILAGTTTHTVFSVSLSHTFTYAELGETGYSSEAVAKARDSFHPNDVVTALLYDHPYEMFWYDKTSGVHMGGSTGISYDSNEIRLTFNLDCSFCVCQDYSATGVVGSYDLGDVITRLNTAVARAQSVVTTYAGLSDLEKLAAYKEWICTETDYNKPASQGSANYGDPWQMIYVFDNDDTTKVVCEGYSKAFKYLCDQSDFNSDKIGCYVVSGMMGVDDGNPGAHMWNIVTLEDGNRYLVDVTNCDKGSIGYPDDLFLKQSNRTISRTESSYETTQYDFWVSLESTVHYYYNETTENAYRNNHSILELYQEYGQIDVVFRHTCSFQNSLAVNYYVKESELADCSDIYLEVDGAGKSSKKIRGTRTSVEGENYYRFQLSGIYSMYMGDTIQAVVHVTKNGVECISDRDLYSVKKYAYNTLSMSYGQTFNTFMVDMLYYGSALTSYLYVDPYDFMFVTNDLTDAQKQLKSSDPVLTTEAATVKVNQTAVPNPTVEFFGCRGYLSDNIAIGVQVRINQSSLDNVKAVFTYESKAEGKTIVKEVPASAFELIQEGNNNYIVKLDSIVAQDARSVFTLEFFDGDQQISDTFESSVERYMAGLKKNNPNNEKLKTLVNNLMNYCISAENYFAEKRGA